MKKHTVASVAIAGALGIVGLGTAGTVSALSNSSSASDSLVNRLVETFNLDKAEVEAVFSEERATREDEMKTERSERLQDLVDEGEITTEQKTAIETKLEELQTERENERSALESWAEENGIDVRHLMMRGPDSINNRLDEAVEDGEITEEQKQLIEAKQDELQDTREQKRDELEQWAEDNDIDERHLVGGAMGGHGHGPGFGGMR